MASFAFLTYLYHEDDYGLRMLFHIACFVNDVDDKWKVRVVVSISVWMYEVDNWIACGYWVSFIPSSISQARFIKKDLGADPTCD